MYTADKQRIGSVEAICAGKFFTLAKMEKIIAGAFTILKNIGIALHDEPAVEKLKAAGFQVNDKRILIEEKLAKGFLDETRAQMADEAAGQCHDDDLRLSGWINPYVDHYEDPEDQSLKRYDCASLAEMTQLLEKHGRIEGYDPSVPGYPADVPHELTSLARYKIQVENCRSDTYQDADTVLAAGYLFDMADVVGQKVATVPLYIISPLTLGGESYDIIIKHTRKVPCIRVGGMPAFGMSMPMSVSAAFSLSLAESLGCAVIMRELTGLPVRFKTGMFPYDFRRVDYIYGSPERPVFCLLEKKFNSAIFGQPSTVRMDIYTSAKRSGFLSGLERGTAMLMGALNGIRRFDGMGSLGFGFSPLQMVLDVEMMSLVSKMIAGVEVDCMPENIEQIVRAGLSGGVAASDLTLDNHERHIWYSKLFARHLGSLREMDAARQLIRELQARPVEYQLDADKARDVNDIYAHALRSLNR